VLSNKFGSFFFFWCPRWLTFPLNVKQQFSTTCAMIQKIIIIISKIINVINQDGLVVYFDKVNVAFKKVAFRRKIVWRPSYTWSQMSKFNLLFYSWICMLQIFATLVRAPHSQQEQTTNKNKTQHQTETQSSTSQRNRDHQGETFTFPVSYLPSSLKRETEALQMHPFPPMGLEVQALPCTPSRAPGYPSTFLCLISHHLREKKGSGAG
jgi:hypothetical protein